MKKTPAIPGSRIDPETAVPSTDMRAIGGIPYTDLEIQVAALTTQGKTPREIAEQLMISIPTVRDLLKMVSAKTRGEIKGC